VILLLLAVGCDPPATLYPTDPCRLGDAFANVSADLSCTSGGTTLTARFDWDADLRAGGGAGDWDGTSFYAAGSSLGGGTISVGYVPGGLGVYGREGDVSAVAGFLPAGNERPTAPYVELADGTTTCDASTGSGSVTLRGLPTTWATDGDWGMDFDAGVADADPVIVSWSPSWPATCPINPRAWATVRITARCEGDPRAEILFLAPEAYQVELGVVGQVDTVSATWSEAFAATCEGGATAGLGGSLQGDHGALRFSTPVLTATRAAGGAWALESTACGTCPAGWDVTVEGLPDL
jgi:hypothetical protein